MNQEKFDSHIIAGLKMAAFSRNTYFELVDVYKLCKMPVSVTGSSIGSIHISDHAPITLTLFLQRPI